jgi:hypothetical protein
MKDLRNLHRRVRRRLPMEDVEFFKRFGSTFFLWWLEHVALRARPEMRTAEGDELVLSRAVFDVRDRPRVERALAAHPDIDRQDDGSYAVLEAISKPRADRGRALLEQLVGDAVQHRGTSLEGVERALDRRPAAPACRVDEIPREVAAQVVGAYYDRHYRDWLDTPLPALDGDTPRSAAASKTGRPRLVTLLKDMESLSSRERLAGRPAYDFGWMSAELGLERPG